MLFELRYKILFVNSNGLQYPLRMDYNALKENGFKCELAEYFLRK